MVTDSWNGARMGVMTFQNMRTGKDIETQSRLGLFLRNRVPATGHHGRGRADRERNSQNDGQCTRIQCGLQPPPCAHRTLCARGSGRLPNAAQNPVGQVWRTIRKGLRPDLRKRLFKMIPLHVTYYTA